MIGGEKVSLTGVERKIRKLFKPQWLSVKARPDSEYGHRIVVYLDESTYQEKITEKGVWSLSKKHGIQLTQEEMPAEWIPVPESIWADRKPAESDLKRLYVAYANLK